MKSSTLGFLLLASAACAQTPPAETAGQAAAPAALAETTQKPILPLLEPEQFICGDGQRVALTHDKPAGILRGVRGGEEFTLQEQVGREQLIFVNGSDTVAIVGDTAHLARGKGVRQTCERVPAEPVSGVIWGTISKLDRMGLVPQTKARVSLVDASRADAPSVEIASTSIETVGNQVPLWFLIRYDPEKIAPNAQIRLQARVNAPNGSLRYITDTAYPVLQDGKPQPPVEIMLARAGGQRP